MKTKNILFAVFMSTILVTFSACNNKKVKTTSADLAHSSMNSLDWQGVYMGTLPCASCEGIETSLQLNQDLTYTLRTKYLGTEGKVFEEKGTFEWNNTGNAVKLNNPAEGEQAAQFKIGEGKATRLDAEGNEVTGDLASHYILEKIEMDNRIIEKYWKLVELNGNPVEITDGMREPHFILRTEDNRVNGNGSCNGFFGSYTLDEAANKISFSKMGSTMMACLNMGVERDFLNMLEIVDSYNVNADRLTLNKTDNTKPLAVFEAVYLY